MSLFSRFQKPDEIENAEPTITWATNAPAHWPPVVTQVLPVPTAAERAKAAVNHLFFASRLAQIFAEAGGDLKLEGVAETRLLDEGLLELQFTVLDQGQRVSVLLFPEANESTGALYLGIAAVLESLGQPTPVYYAPAPLPTADPFVELRTFAPDWLVNSEEPPAAGNYAMWAEHPEEPVFSQSPSMESIGRAYRASSGIDSYIAAAFLREFGLVPEDAGRIDLPEELMTLAAQGPEGQPLILSISREKGVRFHFHSECPPQYRNRFWHCYARFCEGMREHVLNHGLSADDPDDPQQWWLHSEQFVRQKIDEGAEPVQAFGAIHFGED